MATNYNITMKRYNGTDYDILYPRTLPSQIDGGVYTKDEATGLFLSKTGGQMSGLLDMNGNKISNLAEPTDDFDAVTKYYVDNNSYIQTISLATFSSQEGIGTKNVPVSKIMGLVGLHIFGQFNLKKWTSSLMQNPTIYINFINNIRTTEIKIFACAAPTDADGPIVKINQVLYFNNYFERANIQGTDINNPGYEYGTNEYLLFDATSGATISTNGFASLQTYNITVDGIVYPSK